MPRNGTAFADLLVPAAEVLAAVRAARAECARLAVAIAQAWAIDHHRLCHDCERTCRELGADIEAAILENIPNGGLHDENPATAHDQS